jgi:hypothetical protein
MGKKIKTAQRGLFSPVVLVGAALLVAGAVGLQPACDGLINYFSKEAIAIRKPLEEFDVNGLMSFTESPPQPGDVPIADEQDLGTAEGVVKFFSPKEAPESLSAERVRFFVTYYSDPRDQVPHTPEVCFRQSGTVVAGITSTTVPLPALAPDTPEITVRQLELGKEGTRAILLYFFCCNGSFYHDRERVRFAIGMPGDKYVYFSKVEAIMQWPKGATRDEVVGTCRDLLSEAVPILVRDHFPTAEQLMRRE